ncbi:hypothetical protein V8E36_006824 [Tilletia maclaganii]
MISLQKRLEAYQSDDSPLISCFRPSAVQNQAKNRECLKAAYTHCGGHLSSQNSPGWKQAYSSCLSKYWITVTKNNQCPHRDFGCLCYNGCVADVHGKVIDVGGWCTQACKDANGEPESCGGQ